MPKCKHCGEKYLSTTFLSKPPERRWKETGERILSERKNTTFQELRDRGMPLGCTCCTMVTYMNFYFMYLKDNPDKVSKPMKEEQQE